MEAQDDLEEFDGEQLPSMEALLQLTHKKKNTWRSGVRFAGRAASQLHGGFPP